jgi:peptidoglycan hydrolase-like protein with peptidoglycan-binding domain
MKKFIITESERSEILKMHKNAILSERNSLINEESIVTKAALDQLNAGKVLYDWEITFDGADGNYTKIYSLPLQNNDEFYSGNDAKFYEPTDQGLSIVGHKVIGPTKMSQNQQDGKLSAPVAKAPIVCAKSEQDLSKKIYLRKGCKNDFVKQLQMLLDVKGYGTTLGKASIDGNFGDATKNAVMKFQKENNLKVDGIVGMQTWRTLQALESVQSKTVEPQRVVPTAQQPTPKQPVAPQQPATPEPAPTRRDQTRERQDLRRSQRRDRQDQRARQRAQR